MSWHDVMRMPIRSFWSLVKNHPRLAAEEQLRQLETHISASNGESAKALRDRLVNTIKASQPTNPMHETRNHSAGISQLRLLAGGQNVAMG